MPTTTRERAPGIGSARTRLGALALALLVLPATLPSSRLQAQASPADPEPMFDFEQIAPDVWAAVLRERGPFPVTNSLIVVSDDGVLVVDTQQFEPAAREVIAHIRSLTDRPVRWIVNTHAHLDHVGGNAAYREAFGPAVRILGHPATSDAIETATRAALDREVERRTRDLDEQRRRLARMPAGGLLADLRPDMERMLARLSLYLDGLRTLALHPPETTFRSEHVLALGAREVRLIHPGPAHTQGDVVAWLPAEGILFAGDLLEQGISIVGEGATPTGWAAALDSLARLDVRQLLPSHGPVQDRRLLDRQRDLFGTLVREAARARARGLTIDDAWGSVSDALEAALRQGGGGLPVPRAMFLSWVEAALPRAWAEAGGAEAPPPGVR